MSHFKLLIRATIRRRSGYLFISLLWSQWVDLPVWLYVLGSDYTCHIIYTNTEGASTHCSILLGDRCRHPSNDSSAVLIRILFAYLNFLTFCHWCRNVKAEDLLCLPRSKWSELRWVQAVAISHSCQQFSIFVRVCVCVCELTRLIRRSDIKQWGVCVCEGHVSWPCKRRLKWLIVNALTQSPTLQLCVIYLLWCTRCKLITVWSS